MMLFNVSVFYWARWGGCDAALLLLMLIKVIGFPHTY